MNTSHKECKNCGKFFNDETFPNYLNKGSTAKIRNLLLNQRPQTMECEYDKSNSTKHANIILNKQTPKNLVTTKEVKRKVIKKHGKNLSLNAGTSFGMNNNCKALIELKEDFANKKNSRTKARCRCESFDMNNSIAKSLNNFIRNTPVVHTREQKGKNGKFSYFLKEFKSESKNQSQLAF